jgi:hypothetical protein
MTDTLATTNVEAPAVGSDLGPFQALVDYGTLGLVVLALGAIGWYMFKRNMAEKDRMQQELDELRRNKK